MKSCPRCNAPMPSVHVRGEEYRLRKVTHIDRRYIWIDDNEVVRTLPIPVVVVEKVETQKASK